MVELLSQPATIYAGLGPSRREWVDIDSMHYHDAWIKYGLNKTSPPTIFNVIGPDPIPSIGESGVLLTGHDAYEQEKSMGSKKLMCLRFHISDDDALRWMIEICHRHTRLNDFTRAALAFELEGAQLRFQARENMIAGGQGMANLPYPQTNVRRRISAIADVKERTAGKVIFICDRDRAHQDVIRALRDEEISIDRAYHWMRLSHDDQVKALGQHRNQSHANANRTRSEERKFQREVEKSLKGNRDLLKPDQIARALLQTSELKATVIVVESDEQFLAVSSSLLKILRIQASLFPNSGK
jgi:hypothetical protein